MPEIMRFFFSCCQLTEKIITIRVKKKYIDPGLNYEFCLDCLVFIC